MKLPALIYNSELEDQSLPSYIEHYESTYNMAMKEHSIFLPLISRSEMQRAAMLCLKIEVTLRMCHILEKHCGDNPEINITYDSTREN